MSLYDHDAVTRWIDRVYGHTGGLLSIAHADRTGAFVGFDGTRDTHDEAADLIRRLERSGAQGIYLRTTTLSAHPETGKRGGVELSHALPGLWADIDIEGPGHKHDPERHDGRRLPANEEQARRIVAEAGLPTPSLWVHSGGGLYPWWLLDEPLLLDDDNRPRASNVSATWQQALRAAATRLGLEYGAGVGDLPRVLRVPGTVNRKAGLERPCRVVEDTGTAHTFAELAAAAARATSPLIAAPSSSPRPSWGVAGKPSAFEELDDHVAFDDLLVGAGWTRHDGTHPAATQRCWTRPGGTNPCSAHTLTVQPNVLVVHSTEAGLPAGAGRKLTRGRVFAHLHHHGDATAAAADIFAAIARRPCTAAAAALPLPRTTTASRSNSDLAGVIEPPPNDRRPNDQQEQHHEPDTAADAVETELERNWAINREADKLRIVRMARRLVDAEEAGRIEVPDLIRLDEYLARPLNPITHRIAGLWPSGGRVLLAAQWKAGKTTLRDNVIRSLVDGDPFLGVHQVQPIAGTVALLDFELDDQTLQRWLADQSYQAPHRVHVQSMKGRVAAFNILDNDLRARWATKLRDADTSVLVVDCLRPILDALALDENRDAGRFLVALDALVQESGAREVFLVHHMGHGAERSRGDSRLRDWPDAEWRLVRDKEEADPTVDDPSGARYFSAYGRDVDHPQVELTFSSDTRHLAIGELATNRKATGERRKINDSIDAVLAAVEAQPGIQQTRLARRMPSPRRQAQPIHRHRRRTSRNHAPRPEGRATAGHQCRLQSHITFDADHPQPLQADQRVTTLAVAERGKPALRRLGRRRGPPVRRCENWPAVPTSHPTRTIRKARSAARGHQHDERWPAVRGVWLATYAGQAALGVGLEN